MKLGRWSWGYIPVAIVLGLIWYEFWQSGAFAPPPADNSLANTQAAATSVAPLSGATAISAVVEANPRPAERSAQPAFALTRSRVPVAVADPAVNKPGRVIDDAFLNNPPPISVSFSNVNLDTAVEYLRQALGPNAAIQVLYPNNNTSQRFSINAKNVSFWEVIKTLSKQSPVDLATGADYGKEGFILNNSGGGLYRFLTNGPAILYPTNIAYIRQNTGQDPVGTPSPPHYRLTIGAAVDPRIRVTHYAPLELTEVVDDAGHPMGVTRVMSNTSSLPLNCWDATTEITVPELRGKSINVKCRMNFTVQLSENTVEIEDAAHKIGDSFMLGDRGLRLARFDVAGNQVLMQLQLDMPNPSIPIYFTIADANGRSMNFQTQSSQTRSVSVDTMRPPFKLTLRAPDQTRDMVLPFEIKDIPLP